MAKVKALKSLYGDYGQVSEGDVFEVPDSVAKELLKNKHVEEAGEKAKITKEGGSSDEPVKEKTSVSISDNTNKEKKQILGPASATKKK